MRIEHYRFILCLIGCFGGLLPKPFVVEARQRNPLRRSTQTHFTAVAGDRPQESENCLGINTIIGFPYVTGGTTFLEEEGGSDLASISILADRNSNVLQSYEGDNLLDAPGVWYRFHGENNFLQAFLSIANETNQKIALFQGNGCQPTECISLSYHHNENDQLNWFAEEGATYFIKVLGESIDESGIFVLQMEVSKRRKALSGVVPIVHLILNFHRFLNRRN